MFMRLFFLFIIMALTACKPTVHIPPSPGKAVKQTRTVAAFTRVDVTGIIDVSLHTGYSNPLVILHGDPRDLEGVMIVDDNGTLKIKMGEGYPNYGRIKAEVRAHRLKQLNYKGKGIISGGKLRTNGLAISIDNKGHTKLGGYVGLSRVEVLGGGYVEINNVHSSNLRLNVGDHSRLKLQGEANVTNIDMSGRSWLNFRWVKSHILHINARDKAIIQLAGTAQQLRLKLFDNACFKGRYLRVKRAFVKTYDESRAEIAAVKRQHTLASDASNIYLYSLPDMKTDFMAFNGSVLDMRDWNIPHLEEYDQYNLKTKHST